MTTTISSSAVEGALLVRMRRTERELREIEGEVQRWKETLSRGTRSDSRSATELGNGGLDELPGLCAEALQAAMTLRRRAETVRRSMTYIRNTAAEQSAARLGVPASNNSSSLLPGGNINSGSNTPGQNNTTRSPSTSNTGSSNTNNKNKKTTFHSGGGSALAYFVEDFVNSEFGMQEQAWWDVMTDIEGVEALAVSLLSVPSSELSEQRIRDAASLHQSRPAEWTQENWDASLSASVGLPAGMIGDVGLSSSSSKPGGSRNNFSAPPPPRASPLSPSSLYTSFASAPISDLLLRRLQEQNRQKGLYTSSGSHGGGGLADDHNNQQQTSAHVGPIFASLAANPEVMSASDFDRLPKSDPLALFMSQMGDQLQEEQRKLKQLSGGVNDPLRFGSNNYNRRTSNDGGLAGAFDSTAPSYTQVRPDGNVYSPERMGEDFRQRQRDEEERARQAQEQSTEAMMDRKKKEADDQEREDNERLEREHQRREAERKKKEEEEAKIKAEEDEIARKKQEEKDKRAADLAREEAEMKAKEEEISRKMKEQEEAQAKAEKLRVLELAEEEAAAEKSSEYPKATEDDDDKNQKKDDAALGDDASSKPAAKKKKKIDLDADEETEKKQQEEAAAKIQAVKRGNDARKEFEKLKNEKTPEKPTKKDAEVTFAEEGAAAAPEDKNKEETAAKTDGDKKSEDNAAENTNNETASKEQQAEESSTSTEVKNDEAAADEKDEASSPKKEESTVAENSNTKNDDDNADNSSSQAADDGKKGSSGSTSEVDSLVDAALSSGEWKKVKDKSGREYFYHPATKKTCWDLHKEMKKKCKHGKESK